jgi:hypothetical protein
MRRLLIAVALLAGLGAAVNAPAVACGTGDGGHANSPP